MPADEINQLRDIFLVFYGVLFGSLLSAEIGSNHFKAKELANIQPVPWWLPVFVQWLWRVLFLVVLRALFFTWFYTGLDRFAESVAQFTPRPSIRVLAVLALCAPVLGLQQLSYLLVPAPEEPRAMKPSWLLTAAVCAVAPAFTYCWLQ